MKYICCFFFILMIYVYYNTYYIRENFTTKLRDGPQNRFHPTRLRARGRRWMRGKQYNGAINKTKGFANNILWNTVGVKNYF